MYRYPNQQSLTVNKRSATRSTANAAISIPQSVVDVAVLSTESSASQTFVQDQEETMCDYRGASEFSPTNGCTQSEVFPSLESGVENEDTTVIETCGLSGESDSECSEISSSQDSCLVSSESDESELEAQCYTCIRRR